MRIAVAADHAGWPLKAQVLAWLADLGHEPLDLGPPAPDPQDDYPDFAQVVGAAVQAGRTQRGILICGSGVGAAVAANKLRGIRAGLCHDTYTARQGVEHDDLNVLCLGARVIGPALAREIVRAFTSASFNGEARHHRRLAKIRDLEAREGR